MTFIDEPQDHEYAEAFEQNEEEAFGEAMDLSFEIKKELVENTPNGLLAYIRECRADAISELRNITAIDAADVEAVRRIQLAAAVYRSAIEFARKNVIGYKDHLAVQQESEEPPTPD